MGNDQLVLEVQKLAVFGTIIAAFVGGLTGFLGSWIATTSRRGQKGENSC